MSQSDIDQQKQSDDELAGMAGALAKALQQRSTHIQASGKSHYLFGIGMNNKSYSWKTFSINVFLRSDLLF